MKTSKAVHHKLIIRSCHQKLFTRSWRSSEAEDWNI